MITANKRKMGLMILLLSLLLSAARAEEPLPAHELPGGFSYVHEAIGDVILDIRYAGTHNFAGTVIDGYEAPYAILTDKALERLVAAADEFRAMGYRIMIFDAYRPQRAVKHFMRWAKDESDLKMQAEFYPEYSRKTRLVDEGYIARNSSHTRGSALDMTLTDLAGNPLDMGTGFDYFGKAAWHGARGLTDEQKNNRDVLRTVMEKHGFKAFEKEWWHYRLKNEPFPDTAFDFPVR